MYMSGPSKARVIARQAKSSLGKRMRDAQPDAANETAIAIADSGGLPQVPIVNVANDLAYAKYPGQIYVNLDMNAGTSVDQEVGLMPPLQFTERRSGALIEQPAAYEMSIVRFNVNTSDVPIMIVPVKVGQSDPTIMIHDVTIYDNVGTAAYTAPLVWVPQYNSNSIAPVPGPPLVTQDVPENSRYYYLTDYNHFVDILNTALQTCMTDYNTATGHTLAPPFVQYDPGSHLMSISAPAFLFSPQQNGDPPLAGMYFNTALRLLFPGFKEQIYPEGAQNGTTDQTWLYPFDPLPDGSNTFFDIAYAGPSSMSPHQLIPLKSLYTIPAGPADPVMNIPYFDGGGAPTLGVYVTTTQQFPALQNWSTFSGLIFSTTFPIVQESVSNPVAYGQPNLGSVSTNNSTFPIITDFSTVGDIGFEPFNGIVSYTPPGEYRMISLTGTSSIQDLDITVYWKDPYNRKYPLRQWPGSQNNIKIMFRKKNTTV